MPPEVLDVTKSFMRDPIRILVKKEELTLEGIRQFFVNVDKEVGKGFLLFCSNWTQCKARDPSAGFVVISPDFCYPAP